MKRQVITIQEDMVIYAPHHGEVWMTVWEIAELLNVTGTAVKNTIKRIWKQSVLKYTLSLTRRSSDHRKSVV